jgi:regulator of protease activity HflC (stomatin/prohibitin superfamily)
MSESEIVQFERSGAGRRGPSPTASLLKMVAPLVVVGLIVAAYNVTLIDVGSGQIAVLTRKIGKDLVNGDEIAPTPEHKGIQREVLTEGRYFRNPYVWSWEVVPQVEIASGEMGVRVSLTGDDPGYGEFLARVDEKGEAITKGIVPGVLNPGRYPINPYLYMVEKHQPTTIPAGYQGVVTNLAAPLAKDPNTLLVAANERGVQKQTLEPGTHYLNPYVTRVDLVDCRSQRFNLGQEDDMGFPSKDGFWVSLDGVIEFRVNPEKAADVYVLFNRSENGPQIDEEIVQTVIMPNARSFCRLQGSNSSGREFIQGETRSAFQKAFEAEMQKACEPLGIEIIQALITTIRPPEKIAEPVRKREIAKQEELQYKQQTLQQESEQKLAVEKAMVSQKQALVTADQDIVKTTTKAEEDQQVALTLANQQLAVAQLKLEASLDESQAITARGQAAADVVRFENEAEAAGWQTAVQAFSGDGRAYARYVLYQKLSGAWRRMMVNTADSPMMKILDAFTEDASAAVAAPGTPAAPGQPASTLPATTTPAATQPTTPAAAGGQE